MPSQTAITPISPSDSVTADSAPVRLAERGHEPAELEPSFTEWNAHLAEDGRVVPDIARL